MAVNNIKSICSPISREQRALKKAMIIFSVKDRDLFGISNQHVGEGFYLFEDIENSNSLDQKQLKLSRPRTTGSLHLLIVLNEIYS